MPLLAPNCKFETVVVQSEKSGGSGDILLKQSCLIKCKLKDKRYLAKIIGKVYVAHISSEGECFLERC